jgi:haloalkane dehalogenase
VRALYPWPGADLTLRSGHRLHYVDVGQGEPLLMVHGNPTWSFYWRTLIQAFSPEHRCLAVDHLGCGLSDKPRDFPYTLAAHTANLIELIDRLDLRDLTLLVHDWGGAIGFGAAVARPERFRRLVIFNTAAFQGPVPFSIRMSRWPVFGEVALLGFNAFAQVAQIRAISDRRRLAGAVGRGYLAPWDTPENRRATLHFVRDIPMSTDHPTWPVIDTLHRRLPELQHLPAILFWGMQDFCFTPKFLDVWRGIYPKAEVETYHDAAHYVVEDAHERIVPRLKTFLAQHPLAEPA